MKKFVLFCKGVKRLVLEKSYTWVKNKVKKQAKKEGVLKMGRKAMPAKLHVLQGNPNRKTKAELEQMEKAEESLQFAKGAVRPPTWLDPEAKKIFRKLVKDMESADILKNVDIHALAFFSDAYSDYISFSKIIAEEGTMVEYTNKAAETNKVPHPLFPKKKAAFEQMNKIMGDFGLNPVARARLVGNLTSPTKDQKNPFSDRL
jgi:P27 family predicted phage terminase small subunit